nr:MAG TPA: anaerobic ribonucleoside triphosphate reductase [Caudoviricetes sp.]
MQVIKRDGRKVPFNKEKIKKAISSAFYDIDKKQTDESKEIADKIANEVSNIKKQEIDVEEIQNIVEKKLMSTSRKDVAKRYIIYRNDRNRARYKNSDFMKKISEKIFATNVENQNANVDEKSFGGRMGAANSELMKQYALDYIVSPMARENHLNNEIYIHDLDSYAVGLHNCLTIPFDDLLANGFNTRQTDVRPANSINTAFQLLAVIFQLQSLQQFGGVSASHLDWTMVPYVRKSFSKHFRDGIKYLQPKDDPSRVPNELSLDDKEANDKHNQKAYQYAVDMTKKELKQAVEGMYHNLNTLQSRSGNQLPFTSINYGTCTLAEGRMVTKALLEGSITGVGKLHKTSVFPCSIFQCMNGVNRHKGEPNYDLFQLALKSTAQRLYPNYANVDWSGNEGYDRNDPRTYFSTMGYVTMAHSKPFELRP